VHFIDTNVLVYSFSTSPQDKRKFEIAADILEQPNCALSVQVLQEFYTQAIRPTRQGRLTHAEAMRFVRRFCEFPVQTITLEIYQAALATCHRYQISYWDAAIVEAARALGCDMILSEDLQNGQAFGDLRVINPFPLK